MGPPANKSKARASGPVAFGSRSLVKVGIERTTEGKHKSKIQMESMNAVLFFSLNMMFISSMKSTSPHFYL